MKILHRQSIICFLLIIYLLHSDDAAASDCLTTVPIFTNQTIIANLDGSECFLNDVDPTNDFSYFELYLLTITSPAPITITMESNDFDTLIALFTDGILEDLQDESTLVAINDDADETTTNSRITVNLIPGNYVILVNSFSEYQTGTYKLKTVSIIDTDGDGITDNLDNDDDNDGMPDEFELTNRFNPLDSSDAFADADGDGYTNLEEYQGRSDPLDSSSIPRTVPLPFLPLLLE